MIRQILLLFLVVWSFSSQACPCGCGSKTPLSLFPGEKVKMSTKLSREFDRKVISYRGKVGRESAPTSVDRLDLGLAYAQNDDLSYSVMVGVLQNYHPKMGNEAALDDPTIGVAWVAHRHSFAQPVVPQVDLSLSYKQSIGKSAGDGASKRYAMDVASNGFNELVPSVGFGWKVDTFDLLLAQDLVFRSTKRESFEDETVVKRSGLIYRTTAGVSHTWYGYSTLGVSFTRAYKAPDQRDDREIPDSDTMTHAVTYSFQQRIANQKTIALSYNLSGYPPWDKNTSRTRIAALTYSQTIW